MAIILRGASAASLRQNCVTVFSFSKNHFSSPSGRWSIVNERSEERFSRNAETDLVCRLLLEKKKKNYTRCQHAIENRVDSNIDISHRTFRITVIHPDLKSLAH